MFRAMDRRRAGIGLAFGAALISGVSVWLNAFAVKALGDPVLYTTVKNVIAAGLIVSASMVLTARSSRYGLTRPHGRRQLVGLGFVGLIGGGAAFVLFFEGLARTNASSAGFIQKTLVIWVAIIAVSVLRERFERAQLAAIAVLVAGQLLVSGGSAVSAPGTGESLVFAATLLWAIEVVVAKRLLADLSPLTVASARMAVGGIALVAVSVVTGRAAVLASLTPDQWAWVVLTGVILSVYVGTWLFALARAQATDVTAVLVCGAIVTAVLNTGARPVALAPAAMPLALIAIGGIALAALASRSPSLPRRPA